MGLLDAQMSDKGAYVHSPPEARPRGAWCPQLRRPDAPPKKLRFTPEAAKLMYDWIAGGARER